MARMAAEETRERNEADREVLIRAAGAAEGRAEACQAATQHLEAELGAYKVRTVSMAPDPLFAWSVGDLS